MFNEDQKDHMRSLASIPRHLRCKCGWYHKGACPNGSCADERLICPECATPWMKFSNGYSCNKCGYPLPLPTTDGTSTEPTRHREQLLEQILSWSKGYGCLPWVRHRRHPNAEGYLTPGGRIFYYDQQKDKAFHLDYTPEQVEAWLEEGAYEFVLVRPENIPQTLRRALEAVINKENP